MFAAAVIQLPPLHQQTEWLSMSVVEHEYYQRLLLDAMNGDASLFARSDEVELAWGIIDPIQKPR